MPEKKWIKCWEREYNILKMDECICSINTDYFAKQFGGLRLSRVFAIRMPNRNDAFCVEAGGYATLLSMLKKNLLYASNYRIYMREYVRLRSKILQVSKVVGDKARVAKTGDALLKLLDTFTAINSQNMVIGQWASFIMTEHAVDIATELVQKYINEQTQHEKIIHSILSPDTMSQIRKERMSLLRAYLASTKIAKARALDSHISRFEWIPCINIIEPRPWGRDHFASELKKIKSKKAAQQELTELQNIYRANKKKFIAIKKRFPKKEHALLDRLHEMAFIKDDRDDTRRKSYYFATALYERIAQYIGCAPDDINYYTQAEMKNALRAKKPLASRAIRQRMRAYALVHATPKTAVHVDTKTYQSCLKKIQQKINGEHSAKGIIASRGIVQGRACIVANLYSLNKVQKGDILITVTTHPDYLPAMRLAAAFVTDEGGLTSHAAIVAREMGKPCIVGTKHATKVFKDGDMVEVDANHGWVRKL